MAVDPSFLAVAASVEELVHVWSLTGEVRWINGSFERVLQLGLAELGADRVVAEDLPGVRAALTAFLASSATSSGSIDCRCLDASRRAIALTSVVHRVTWQDEPTLLVVSRPTTASAVDDRRFRLMVENFNDILLIMDKEGVERFVSPACERILGFRPDELIGHFGLEFVHPDDQGAIRAGLVATVRKEIHTATFEFRHVHRDGGWRWLEAAGTSLLDDPCIAGVVLIARDVTARRLAEDELRQAQKLESVGRLAGGIAHDFNNLLTAIKGNLSLVLDALHGEHPVRELVAEADQATSTAAHLTHQLLAFSRKQVIAPRVLALPETIGHLQRMLGRVLGERITLSTTIAPGLWRVKIDPGQLEQILMNLTLNARDAMPAGGRLAIVASNVRLDERFAATTHLAGRDYVKLEVTDTGTGIADEVRAHVFEPFYTTKDIGQGTGLGLASVYGAVKQNLGHVEVGPTQPIGTTFVVYLPRTDEASEATPRTRSVAPRGTETILLVEDDDGVRKLALRVLVRQGYRVFAYDSGDAALAAVATLAEPPQMLVTDVIMPGMNGKVLADLLRARLPALKVLFTSGYSADTIAQQGIIDAGVEFLDKPYTLDKLAVRVREILDAP